MICTCILLLANFQPFHMFFLLLPLRVVSLQFMDLFLPITGLVIGQLPSVP